MKVRFTADFDYTPSLKRRVTYAFRAGWSGTVKRECGEAAIAAGTAEEIETAATATTEDVSNDEGGAI